MGCGEDASTGHMGRDANANAPVETYADCSARRSQGRSGSHADANPKTDGVCNTDSSTDLDASADTDAEANGYHGLAVNAYTISHARTYADAEAHGHSQPDAYRRTYSNADSHADRTRTRGVQGEGFY